MFIFLARVTSRRYWWFLAAGVLVLIAGITYGLGVFGALKSGGMTAPNSASAQEAREAAQAFPQDRLSLILLMHSPTLTVGDPKFASTAAPLLAAIRRDPATVSVTSDFDTPDAVLISRDGHATFAVVSLRGDESTQEAAYLRLRRTLPSGPLSISWGGPVVANHEINAQVARDIPRAEMISAPLLLILLVLIFRSFVAAALPLVIGALSILGAFALMRVIAEHADISVFAANIISLLGLGLAIDYSLLLLSRFRDEMAMGKTIPDCLERTLETAGESVFFSGCTVSLSMLGLLVFRENFLRSMGLGGALAVFTAMAASLTILPAILALLGPRVNWGTVPLPRRRTRPYLEQQGAWYTLSHWVMRHAVLVIVVTLGLLLAAGLPTRHIRFADPGIVSMPPTFQARITGMALRRDFENGQDAPIQILLQMPASPISPQQLTALSAYVTRLRAVPGVQNIGSLVTLDASLTTTEYAVLYGLPFNADAQAAETHYLSRDRTLLTVGYAGDSQSPAAQRLLKAVRAVPLPSGASALVGGDTAELVDHLASLQDRLPLAASIILGTTFVLLFLLLHSLIVPLKAVVLNVLSLAATFGFMTWVFQDGHFERLLDFTSSGSLDAAIPVLVFALAFGLSTDYEVFLVSRIREEYERTGDNTGSIALGVEKTGRIITSAALLLIVVVSAFGASQVLAMKEIGIGMAVAVAIDAAIVRSLLVPATMRVLGDWNWWLPPLLRRTRP
jgi:uncharacterized membrane protein YdfJ with MMPL/SSD domain